MKKTLLTNLKYIALGLVLAVGISYVSAGVWKAAPANPPANNTDYPVNVSTEDQIKAGGLQVNQFTAATNAQFEQMFQVNGILRGDDPKQTPPSQSTVKFGGTDLLGVNRVVDLLMKGSLESKGSIAIQTLSNPSMQEVCSDKDGNLTLCPPSNAVCTVSEINPESQALLSALYYSPVPFAQTTIFVRASSGCTGQLFAYTPTGATVGPYGNNQSKKTGDANSRPDQSTGGRIISFQSFPTADTIIEVQDSLGKIIAGVPIRVIPYGSYAAIDEYPTGTFILHATIERGSGNLPKNIPMTYRMKVKRANGTISTIEFPIKIAEKSIHGTYSDYTANSNNHINPGGITETHAVNDPLKPVALVNVNTGQEKPLLEYMYSAFGPGIQGSRFVTGVSFGCIVMPVPAGINQADLIASNIPLCQ